MPSLHWILGRPSHSTTLPPLAPLPLHAPSPTIYLASLLAGPLAALLVWCLPLPEVTRPEQQLCAILTGVMVYWIFQPIPLPVTALLGTALCVIVGLGPASTIFTAYAHPVVFLFIGSFWIAAALSIHGVDRRLALWILTQPWALTSPSRLLLVLTGSTALLSMWISNTAATAIMLPVALGIWSTLKDTTPAPAPHFQIALLLSLSYAATAGGLMTLVGTPPNLIGVGLIAQHTGITLSFLMWLAIGLPLGILLLLAWWGLLVLGYPAGSLTLTDLHPTLLQHRASLGPWTRGQYWSCLAFSLALVGWIGPGILVSLLGPTHPLARTALQACPPDLVALLAASLLFILPVDLPHGRFTLSWLQASQINWGTILLFGGGLAFGNLILTTGLSHTVGHLTMALLGSTNVWTITAMAIVLTIGVSELASNTAAASMAIPLVIALADAAQVPVIPPALGACLAASLGFALPISTPPNTIVYSTGHIPMAAMIRTGLIIDLLGGGLIWLTLRLLCPLLGLA